MRTYPLILLLLPIIVAIVLLHGRQATFTPAGEHCYKLLVLDEPVPRPKTMRLEVQVLDCIDTFNIYSGAQAYAYVDKSDSDAASIRMGDTLLVRTRWNDGRVLSGYVPKGAWRCRSHAVVPWYHPRKIRQILINRYRSLGIGGAELQTLSALTLGYKDELDKDLRLSFQRAGAAHVLAVSGLHTGILYTIIVAVLTFFGFNRPLHEEKLRRWMLSATVIALLWAYAALTGFCPSVLRSVIMLTVFQIGISISRHSMSVNTLLAAAIVILIFRPQDLFSVGFWLSFSAVAALLLITPHVRGYWQGIVLASLGAQLGTLPITLYCFSEMSNYFLLTNLMVLPLVQVILSMAIATLALGWIPILGPWLASATGGLVWLLNSAVGWVESLPGAVTTIRCSVTMMVLLYAAIIMGALSLRRSLWWTIGVITSMIIWCYLYMYE